MNNERFDAAMKTVFRDTWTDMRDRVSDETQLTLTRRQLDALISAYMAQNDTIQASIDAEKGREERYQENQQSTKDAAAKQLADRVRKGDDVE